MTSLIRIFRRAIFHMLLTKNCRLLIMVIKIMWQKTKNH